MARSIESGRTVKEPATNASQDACRGAQAHQLSIGGTGDAGGESVAGHWRGISCAWTRGVCAAIGMGCAGVAQGQLPGTGLTVPTPLPSPSIVQHNLFEQPWIVVALALVAGVVLAMVLNGRGKGRAALMAFLVSGLVAGGVFLASEAVTTPREKIDQSARALVAAVAAGDATGMGERLTSDATMRAWLFPIEVDRDRIIDEASKRFGDGEFRLSSWSIEELQASQAGPEVGVVQVKIRAVPARDGTIAHFSWWRLDLRLEGGEWRVRHVEPISVQFVTNPVGG
ncbi:MAG: hypothetical protein IPK69_08610 [Phycisphaerales bacterium]|nr:MAG: hypothetical protein IPK69_08610 [Phycisphaerales bacterium]